MSEQQSQTATAVQDRPAPEDYWSWREYWKTQGMPWRTEPEIDEERQRNLAKRRAIVLDIERRSYPFKDIKLSRADVEWLLATHSDGRGTLGPVEWHGEREWRLDGLDVRGADLSGANLANLPLTRLLGSLRYDEWQEATSQQREDAAVHLEQCNLRETHLEGAHLRSVHLEQASLKNAHLQGARLQDAHLEGANLAYAHLEGVWLNGAHFGGKRLQRESLTLLRQRVPTFPGVVAPGSLKFAYLDAATTLDQVDFGNDAGGWAILSDVQWGGANATVVDWSRVHMLGDEREARTSRRLDGMRKPRPLRLDEYGAAVRANRQISTVLRTQGLSEDADRFAFRAQLLQRVVLRRQLHPLRYFGSLMLWLIAGYGYKPLRSFITYLLVVGAFALTYYLLGDNVNPPLDPLGAVVFSITSFHGRGFAPGENVLITNPLTVLAAAEAIIGLLIEITFIATFTQRFFAR